MSPNGWKAMFYGLATICDANGVMFFQRAPWFAAALILVAAGFWRVGVEIGR